MAIICLLGLFDAIFPAIYIIRCRMTLRMKFEHWIEENYKIKKILNIIPQFMWKS